MVTKPLARSPLHDWHLAQGARLIERDGWQIVADYGRGEHESAAARSGVGLADLSAAAKCSFRGPGVESLLRSLVPDGVLSRGRVAPVLQGKAVLCRLTDEHLLAVSDNPADVAALEALARLPQVVATDVTSALARLALVGPRVEEVLRRLTQLDLGTALPPGHCAETALTGMEALLVRLPRSALPAVHIYVAWDVAECAWERVLEAGHDARIALLGTDAQVALAQ